MADFPVFHGCSYTTVGADTGTSYATTVTTSATIHTKGSWTEITASIPDNVVGFWFIAEYPSSLRYLVDIGVGSGPTVLLSNVLAHKRIQVSVPAVWFPMALPPGESLQVRAQCGGSSGTIQCAFIFAIGSFPAARPLGAADTYGADTGTSTGTTIDPGASANTKGSWTEITSSTTSDIHALVPLVAPGYDTTSPAAFNIGWLVDIGVGAASSEQTLIANIPMMCSGTSDVIDTVVPQGPFDLLIPSGTRVAVRAQCSSTDATYRPFRIVLIGLR